MKREELVEVVGSGVDELKLILCELEVEGRRMKKRLKYYEGKGDDKKVEGLRVEVVLLQKKYGSILSVVRFLETIK